MHEGQVCAGAKGHVHVGNAGRIGAARVGHNDFYTRLYLLAAGNAAKQYGVRLGGIGTDDEKAGGLVNIGIGSHGLVLAERGGVAAHSRGHAQAGVAVHVIGAKAALENLVGKVALFGQALARTVPGHRIGAKGVYAVPELGSHEVKGFVPAYGFKGATLGAAPHGLGNALFGIEHRDE